MERDEVIEYKEREESDDEYDEVIFQFYGKCFQFMFLNEIKQFWNLVNEKEYVQIFVPFVFQDAFSNDMPTARTRRLMAMTCMQMLITVKFMC